MAKSQCLISFGSNLGSRHRSIADAASLIAASEWVDELRTSRLFETPPVGGPDGQDPFLNAVAAFETSASAREILSLLQQTEQRLGRRRLRRWDSRSIDLDVVLHGQLVGGGTGLIVPHPRYTARQFVLQPACDVAAHFRDPRFGWTLRRLARHLNEAVPSLALVAGEESERDEICKRLAEEHPIDVVLAERDRVLKVAVVGNAPAAIRHAEETQAQQISVSGERPWVSAFLPPLPPIESPTTASIGVPRLVARIQRASSATRWPAPHQMWPSGWRWPEYRLEIDDLDWAVAEVASALDSMRCPVTPVTDDGNWWR